MFHHNKNTGFSLMNTMEFSNVSIAGFGPANTSQSPHARLKTLEFRNVSLNEGFWVKKTNVNRKISLHFGFEML